VLCFGLGYERAHARQEDTCSSASSFAMNTLLDPIFLDLIFPFR
jgi:hypothetical protein